MQQNELPEGWAWTNYGYVISKMANGTTIKQNKDNRGIPVTRIETISNGVIDSNRFGYVEDIDEKNLEKYSLVDGDVLFSHINSDIHLGKTAIYESKPELLLHGMNLLLLRPNKSVIFPHYLHYLSVFYRVTGEFISVAQHAVNQSSINQKILSSIEIPLPPLPEQHRIVEAIEALFARLDATNERVDRVPGIMKTFRQAVLAAACDGRLTEDWRVIHQNSQVESEIFEKKINANSIYFSEKPMTFDNEVFPTLPDNWCWATIEELASAEPRSIQSGPFGSSLLHSEFKETGILAVGIDNVLDRNFSLGKEHRISNEKYQELKKYTARPLDVLITVMATVGRCCVVPQDIETAIITKHVYRITPNRETISPYYLMNALSGASIVKEQIDNQIRGQTRPGINGKILKTTSIPLPPLSEQQEIVQRVDALFAFADSIEAKVAVSREKTERLRQSILAKAFSGELVPTEAELARQEGRRYESAEVLLKRIKREGMSGKK